MKQIARMLLAEFMGTFCLSLGVLAAFRLQGYFPIVVMAAIIVGLFVYLVGPISGAHFNPAISIGLWSVGKIDGLTAGAYIITQIIGGFAAFGLMTWLVPEPHLIAAVDSLPVFVGEILGAFIFSFGIAAVVFGKTKQELSGLIVGTSLFVAINLAAIASNGVINPAVALAINSVSLAYVLAPVVGAVLGFKTFEWMSR